MLHFIKFIVEIIQLLLTVAIKKKQRGVYILSPLFKKYFPKYTDCFFNCYYFYVSL